MFCVGSELWINDEIQCSEMIVHGINSLIMSIRTFWGSFFKKVESWSNSWFFLSFSRTIFFRAATSCLSAENEILNFTKNTKNTVYLQ